jgi:hypothetical protein
MFSPFEVDYTTDDTEYGVYDQQTGQDMLIWTQTAPDLETMKMVEDRDKYTDIMPCGVKIDSDTKLSKGDHIFIICTDPIVYEHHGIYAGDSIVIHFSNWIV